MPRPADGLRRSLGWQLISWIEHFCIHGPGDVAGDAADVDDEFALFIVRCYQLNGRGRRLAARAFLSRMKGRAKSALAGWVACAEALGPVRFDHWAAAGETLEIGDWIYEFEEGEPVGRPVHSPEILCFATEEGQAGNTYDVVHACMGGSKIKLAYPGVDAGLTRTNLPDGGTIEPVSSAANSKDGGKSTFVVFDETHLWYTAELRRTFATVMRNLGKRKLSHPWALETSTMYMPGQGSVAEDSHKYAKSIADGTRRKDRTFLFDHREGPSDFNWDSNTELRAALKYAAGSAAAWMAFDDIIIKIRDPQADDADSRRFWLNQVVAATEQAIDMRQWHLRRRPKLKVASGEKIALGFDGSRNKDSTALWGARLTDGLLFKVGVWERPEVTASWEISGAKVDSRMRWAFGEFDVARLYGDPFGWGPYFDAWEAEWDKRVVRYYFTSEKKVALAQRDFVVDLRNADDFIHDDDPTLNRHAGNARRRYLKIVDFDTRRPLWVFSKEHPNSPLCIDALTSAFLARLARGDAIAAGALNTEGSAAAAFFDGVTWTCSCGQRNAKKWPRCRSCDAAQPELEPVG